VAPAHVLEESKTVLVFVGSAAARLTDVASLRGPISGLRVDKIANLSDSGYVISEIAGRPHRDEPSGDSGEPGK